MNFLILMLGRGVRGEGAAGTRPNGRQMLLARAAKDAAKGRLDQALKAYRELAGTQRGTTRDLLTRAHLHLALGEHAEAGRYFLQGIERLMAYRPTERVVGEGRGAMESVYAGHEGAAVSIEAALSEADALLRRRRFGRATEALQRVRSLLDAMLTAESGRMVAQVGPGQDPLSEDATGASPPGAMLVTLAKMGDMMLRLVARAHLAEHLAHALRERRLHAELASWATTTRRVEDLLQAELERLHAVTQAFPGHAESHYRLGLVARALGGGGRRAAAAAAFAAALRIHPHHVSCAARLAATHTEMGGGAEIRRENEEVLARAFIVPAETLRRFAAFAQAAADGCGFDEAAARTLAGMKKPQRAAARANLAFALSQLAMLDVARETWREPAACV